MPNLQSSHVALVHRAQLRSGQVHDEYPDFLTTGVTYLYSLDAVDGLGLLDRFYICNDKRRCCWFLVQLEELEFLLYKLARPVVPLL